MFVKRLLHVITMKFNFSLYFVAALCYQYHDKYCDITELLWNGWMLPRNTLVPVCVCVYNGSE